MYAEENTHQAGSFEHRGAGAPSLGDIRDKVHIP